MQFEEYWVLFGGIVATIVSLLYFCIVFRNYKHIKTAIQVIDAAADFMIDHKRVMIIPFFYFIVNLLFIFMCVYNVGLIMSMNVISVEQSVCTGDLCGYYKDMKWKTINYFYMVFTIVALVWFTFWIQYSCVFAIMFSSATYYFNSDEQDIGQAEVGLALKMTHINHMGTIAFASAVMVPIQFINIFCVIPWKRMANWGKMNCLCRCIVACSDCGLSCFEKLCDYVNDCGLAYIAITGDNFCEGQWKGFMMNVKYMLEFQYSMRVIAIFGFSIKLIIVLLNLATFALFSTVIINDGQTLPSWFPAIIVHVGCTFITASMFCNYFEVVAYTLLMCLSIDNDIHNG